MAKIKNFDALISVGDQASRRIVLTIAETTLERLDSYERIKSIAKREGDLLTIGTRTWDLSTKRHVYLLGAGKACNHMGMALEEILGERLTGGIAIVKSSERTDRFNRTEVHIGGHPIPNEAGYRAALQMLNLADLASSDDLFIAVVSGGSSALMNCPVEGITIQDEMDATDVLLKCGAGIHEINAIRRHISRTNGGRLAQRIAASGAELIGIGISDAVGNSPTGDIRIPRTNYTSTPIGPDPTTLEQARQVIIDHDLAERLPASIVQYLIDAGEAQETPKAFPDNTYFVLNTVPDACVYAKEAAESMGLRAVILTTFLEGESRDAGTMLASLAREIQASDNPIPAPCVLLTAGEVTTSIKPADTIAGHGGPGQEMVTSFALTAVKTKGAALLSIDTEGTDGSSGMAGGVCDSSSLSRAQHVRTNLHTALRQHATFEALDAIGDAILTGNTGTNLCDLNILYVPTVEH